MLPCVRTGGGPKARCLTQEMPTRCRMFSKQQQEEDDNDRHMTQEMPNIILS